MRVLLTAFAIVVMTGVAGYAQGARQRAPQSFSCDTNHLTSYTGVVIRYTRQVGSTTLRIKTDDDTTENVTVKHPGTDDPSALFRYQTEPFTSAHWARIERSKGVLIPNTRAAAWVCDDGQVMVDWGARPDVR